jgi:hypothetical protein
MAQAGPRRTPHEKWAAGAAVILLALVFAVLTRPGPPPSRPAEAVELPPPPPAPPDGRAGRVVCGFCDGDGRIDAADLRREAPRLDVKEGPCPACAGKGGR